MLAHYLHQLVSYQNSYVVIHVLTFSCISSDPSTWTPADRWHEYMHTCISPDTWVHAQLQISSPKYTLPHKCHVLYN